jgi:hypothetical protein
LEEPEHYGESQKPACPEPFKNHWGHAALRLVAA